MIPINITPNQETKLVDLCNFSGTNGRTNQMEIVKKDGYFVLYPYFVTVDGYKGDCERTDTEISKKDFFAYKFVEGLHKLPIGQKVIIDLPNW